ncbi:MAG: tetratricopeptide repeat protein [Rhodocyclaceae bacterium]|nr:MAG: tetratricopeptide repeat protein [Rhodocyclaceae bacterium]
MSLLMEALKKAEEAKRQASDQHASVGQEAFPSLELTPLPESTAEDSGAMLSVDTSPPLPSLTQLGGMNPVTARHSELPELPGNLDALDTEFINLDDRAATVAEPSPTNRFSLSMEPENEIPLAGLGRGMDAPPVQTTELPQHPKKTSGNNGKTLEQAAAHNLFDAKQPSARPRKNFLIGLGLFVVLSFGSLGIYLWLQLQPKSGLALMAPGTPPQIKPVAPISVPVMQPPPPAPQPSDVQATTPAPQTTTAASKKDEDEEESKPQVKAQPTRTAASPSTPQASTPVKITTSKMRVDPSLDNGYEAFQRGDLPTARSAYEAALKNDPNSVDALNGMAMTLMRSGRSDLAEAYFQKALEVDPRNSLAQASLAGLRDTSDPVQAESRLKLALAEQPDAAHLHFALGNLYARQNRWADAQQAYFRAMSGDPENPDYLFNLAVSLDRLHQTKLAAGYYTQAVAAAQKHPAGFDPVQVNERIKKLQL